MSVGLLVVRLLYRLYVCVHLSKWFTFSVFLSVIFCRVVVFYACTQRLRLYAVRDCGQLSCPPTPNFERGRMLELPLKPLLHIAFVRAMCIIFLEVFKYKFHYFVFTQTDFFFVPNFRFRCHFLNFSLLSKMVIRISFLTKWFVSNRTIV